MKKIKVGLIAVFVKLGPKLFALFSKVFKTVKIGKVGLAATSLAAYSYLFTWEFALMIMAMLFIHESGHVWAMKKCGMKTKGFYFIPLLGGAAVAEDSFPSRKAEVFVAIMGPIWGLGTSVATGILYWITGNPIFAAGASWMALVNLFNLLPVNPLDGGRIMKSVAFSISSNTGLVFLGIGLIACGFLTFYLGMGLFLFLLVIGAMELIFEYKERSALEAMTGWQILSSAGIYFLVAGLLWGFMYYTKHIPGSDIALEMLKG